jgi:aconitate hydratase
MTSLDSFQCEGVLDDVAAMRDGTSFERIHRSNLVGMGILPLVLDEGTSWRSLGLTGAETVCIGGIRDMAPRQRITLEIASDYGTLREVPVTSRIDPLDELGFFKHGGILPYVLRQLAA